MKIRFFWVPACHFEDAEDELNRFLAANRVLHLEKEFASREGSGGWSFCIEYLPRSAESTRMRYSQTRSVDYKEVLEPETFNLYAVLRSWRKEKAEDEGVPPYSVATNAQLAAIAEARPTEEGQFPPIEGFGETRKKKYSAAMAKICRNFVEQQKK